MRSKALDLATAFAEGRLDRRELFRHMGRLGRACFSSVRAYLSCFRILFACQSGLVRLDANAAGQSLLAL